MFAGWEGAALRRLRRDIEHLERLYSRRDAGETSADPEDELLLQRLKQLRDQLPPASVLDELLVSLQSSRWDFQGPAYQERVEELVAKLSPQERAEAQELLRHAEVAGGWELGRAFALTSDEQTRSISLSTVQRTT